VITALWATYLVGLAVTVLACLITPPPKRPALGSFVFDLASAIACMVWPVTVVLIVLFCRGKRA
jgi:hypothetical protein